MRVENALSRSPGPFRPGTGYKNGKLYIFEDYSLTVMKPWPKPLAWRRTTRTAFRPVRPEIILAGEDLRGHERPRQVRRHNAIQSFMSAVPEATRGKIGQFAQRQWHMMALLARCPGADDLVASTPALAFALASNWVFAQTPVKQPMRAARSLARKKQTAICDWLGFPPCWSSVNMLRKLRTPDIRIKTLLQLRDVLWDESRAKLLRHAPEITFLSLGIVSSYTRRPHFSAKFIAELGTIPYDETGWERLNILEYGMQGWVLEKAKGKVFDSFAQLKNFAEEERDDRHPVCPEATIFPDPPLAGTEAIVPIRTGRELLNESGAMKHCAANYHDDVAEGSRAFYRLLAPERATIALVRKDGVWRLDQLSGPRNTTVSQAAYRVVYIWIANLAN